MTFLITAGPTIEPIDPVRYLTNHSTGKMGYALAESAAKHGHRVILISGPTQIQVPDGVDFLPVETAAEMYQTTEKYIAKADIAIFAAAVADYTPATVSTHKIKKSGDSMTLELVRTKDILGSARSTMGFAGTLIGFAAESRDLEANARKKLTKKQTDLIIANDISRADIGFQSQHNEVLLVRPEGTEALPKADKNTLAHHLIRQILEIHALKDHE